MVGEYKGSLVDGDLQSVEVLKRHKPLISYSEIKNILGDLPLGSTLTTAALSNAFCQNLSCIMANKSEINQVMQFMDVLIWKARRATCVLLLIFYKCI